MSHAGEVHEDGGLEREKDFTRPDRTIACHGARTRGNLNEEEEIKKKFLPLAGKREHHILSFFLSLSVSHEMC